MAASHTFPKQERLRYGYEFRRVTTEGRRVPGQFATVCVLSAPSKSTRAVGIVTSRRIGSAVARSRARRLLREAYRLNKHNLKDNVQLVIIAKTAINGRSLGEVEADLLRQFRVAGAWKES